MSGIFESMLEMIPAITEPYNPEYIWIVVVGFIIGFITAISVGANDVANSFGTSVGSGVLTLKQACIIASICEISGSILMGTHVAETMRSGIVDITQFDGAEKELLLGYLAALIGTATWIFTATFFRLPVSCSHSAVSATLGFGLAARGNNGIQWLKMRKIGISWVVSPLLSGAISVTLLYIIEYGVMKRGNPLKAGLISLPIIYGLTMFVNVFGVTNKGPELLYLHNISLLWALLIALIAGVCSAIVIQIFVVPIMRRMVQNVCDIRVTDEPQSTPPMSAVTDSKVDPKQEKTKELEQISETPFNSQTQLTKSGKNCCNRQDTESLFSSLQILTACFGSFQHGGNDVANAVGPVIALWVVFSKGSVYESMDKYSTIAILAVGGIGITVGLWLFGRRVIETIGKGLTKIRPSTGFTIEIGSACTVLVASKLGVPVSTTHCKVGSVVFVGYADGRNKAVELAPGEKPVNWRLFGTIFASWIATVPAAVGISALFMWLLKLIFL